MPTATLTYETPQFLQKLLGHDDLASLRHIGETLGVQITSREAWVRLEGEDASIEAARLVFTQLEKVRRQGGEITPAMLRLVTESVSRESGEEPAEITTATAAGLHEVRTSGQRTRNAWCGPLQRATDWRRQSEGHLGQPTGGCGEERDALDARAE